MAKLYAELADWWPLLSPPEDHEEEAAFEHSEIEPGTGELFVAVKPHS